ncbi:hypothetical protein F5B21DRAFT_495506 [Xylaria acuta]|nr:hypothetical protein F5B21DRAFT_495506 [Xylaria acuta]
MPSTPRRSGRPLSNVVYADYARPQRSSRTLDPFMASTQHLPPVYTPQSKPFGSPEKVLHRYKSTFVIACFFLFFLIAPWVFLSILNVKPIGGQHHVSSWQDVSGRISEDAVYTSENLYRASGVLYTVAAVLTLPVLSMVLSHAAVVVVQRRHPDQRLNASQMLTLADAPWSRLPSRLTTSAPGGPYVYGAIALVALGFLQLIVQSALVTWEEVRVATYLDAPNGPWPTGHYREVRYSILGFDPTPHSISQLPIALVTKEVTARLSAESSKGAQLRLWHDGPTPFTAAFPSSVKTGVLRYTAMRLNTSVQCEAVSRDSFPGTCPGPNPFYGNVSLPSLQGEHDPAYGRPNILVRWCVPGNISSSPWSLSRDRQDIAEDLFVDAFLPEGSRSETISESFTTHCWANTTRGYFELPNYHNNFTSGPLLERWISPRGRSATTNDVEEDPDFDWSYIGWSYYSNYPYEGYHEVTPGPLTTAMISMLGNESWILPLQNISETTDPSTLKTIYRDMCTGGIPFQSWEYDGGFSSYRGTCDVRRGSYNAPLSGIKYQTYGWFNYFSRTWSINGTLESAAFFANEATLTRAGIQHYISSYPGVVYTSPGAKVYKPSIPLPAHIVVTILIGAETLTVILLLIYIYRKETFADRLDALVIATIGAQLSAAGVELPHLHETDKKWHKYLQEYDGVIGLSHGSLTDDEWRRNSYGGVAHGEARTNVGNDIQLAAVGEPVPSKILIIGGIGSL